MSSEVRQKKIMEKLNRARKCSILGPQNLGSGGARAPGAPPDPHLFQNRSSWGTNDYLLHDVQFVPFHVISTAPGGHVDHLPQAWYIHVKCTEIVY